MAVSPKACGFVLIVLVLICIQLHEAQFVPGLRCQCQGTIKFTSENISDFQVFEKGPACDKTQLIITLEEDQTKRCLDTDRKLGKAFLQCWNRRINRDERQKSKCIERWNKAHSKE